MPYLCALCVLCGKLFLFYLFQHPGNIDPHRANPDAAPTAGTEGLTKLVIVILELVHDPVAVALGLQVTGVVAGGMIGKL